VNDYDLVVIGAGSGGLSAAPLAAKLGARVALVERYKPGGDCLYTGCVPSKALIKAAKVAHEMRTAETFGIEAHEPVVDLRRVMAHVHEVIGRVYEYETPEALAKKGVEVILGGASFVDPHTIDVGDRQVRAKRFLIATGSRAAVPTIPGVRESGYITYDELFHLARLPEHLLIIGAGPIGVEMAQAFRRLGSRVTMFQRSRRLLGMADADCSAAIARVMESEGVVFHFGAEIGRVSRAGMTYTVESGRDIIEGDQLLVATGRVPNVEGLDLEKAGVVHGAGGIQVDSRLRTSQPHIYACGDVTGGPQFTHYAGMQGYVAVRNALLPGSSSGHMDHVPWTIFTDPEVARAGMTEEEARQRHGADVRVTIRENVHIDRAQTDEDLHGLVKIVHRSSGEILGAHIVSARAGEMIHEFVLAMEQKLKLGDIAETMHVYPTYGIGAQQAAVSWRVDSLLEGLGGRLIAAARKLAG
jgi:pyruvate/2-oxoglutarate dehydrogenase complex dihydrolipoamide dehydrogenase (E3) component